jgi:flagellar motor protein MotB
LFESGHADIKPEGRQAIQQLSQILYGELTKPEYKNAVETVFIEGHTDNVPIQNQYFQSNWELSTQRAINTWNLMRFDVVGLNTLVNANGVPIFSCSGYADTRPVKDDAFDENSVEGRQANRRIDIRFVMMPPKDSNAER